MSETFRKRRQRRPMMPTFPAICRRSGHALRDRRRDRGSVTLELTIFAPALIIMLLFVVAAGRIAQAHQAVEAAARDAARQASIARDPSTARANAISSAQ